MGTIRVNTIGVSATVEALEAYKARVSIATREATKASADALQRSARANFHGYHSPGFHHVGGSAPNIVTGNLQKSIVSSPVVQTGVGRFATRVGPTAIYSRVIELGGYITPKEKRYLSWFDAQVGVQRFEKGVSIPPHPFFVPAAEAMPPKMYEIFLEAWTEAVTS